MRYNFACAYARDLDDKEAALKMLDSAMSRLQGSIGNLEFDPDLECLRDDPRYQKIITDTKARLAKLKARPSA
jgi:hypothetical protein